jgi:hypothetical protein
MKQWFTVTAIISDGNEYNESVKAQEKPQAAFKAWEGMGCDGVETIFVHNESSPGDRAVYHQQAVRLVRQ